MSTGSDENHPAAPEDISEVIAAAVVGTAGVHDLHAGAVGEVATYLPGRRVRGVRLRDPHCDIHLVLGWGWPITETIESVRRAVRPLVAGAIDVTVEDIAEPEEPPP